MRAAFTLLMLALLVLPAGCAARPTEEGDTTWRVDLARAIGSVTHATHGDGANGLGRGSTDGALWLGRVEGFSATGFGGGVAAEIGGSDADLLSDPGFTGGEEESHDLFAYVGGRLRPAESFEVVVRGGPYFHRTEIEPLPSGNPRAWEGTGFRVEASPEWWFHRGAPIDLALYADLAGGLHVTRIRDSIGADSESYSGKGMTLGFGTGIAALAADRIEARVGYLYRLASEDENSDDFVLAPVDPVIPGASTKFSGLMVSVGVRW